METEDFNKELSKLLHRTSAILEHKASEYSKEEDRFENFRQGSALLTVLYSEILSYKADMYDYLIHLFMKHIVSAMTLVEEAKSGEEAVDLVYQLNLINEKFGDAINYLLILQIMIINYYKEEQE